MAVEIVFLALSVGLKELCVFRVQIHFSLSLTLGRIHHGASYITKAGQADTLILLKKAFDDFVFIGFLAAENALFHILGRLLYLCFWFTGDYFIDKAHFKSFFCCKVIISVACIGHFFIAHAGIRSHNFIELFS